jgi:tRNA modification GTPase
MNTLSDTIVALATPPIKSALGIIRMSGPKAFEILSIVFSKNIEDVTEKTIHIGSIVENNEIIDQVVVLQFVAPKSYTGEHLVEIIIHGSPLVAQQVITLLIQHGARQAEPGEFSSRAFLNEKIDLIQAEAIHDMIDATTQESKRLAMFSLTGKTSEKLNPLRTKIADLLALIEVNIDYPEYEDIEQVTREKVMMDTQSIIDFADELIEQGEKGRIIKEGIKVAIIGKPNVGKSSLLNALLQEEKAIVTEIAGTTRDVVEGELNFHGVLLKILDTAGIRNSDDKVENLGIKKTLAVLEEADLVIHVIDGTLNDEAIEGLDAKLLANKPLIKVLNKKDALNTFKEGEVYISALNKDISALEVAMKNLLKLQPSHYLTPSFYNTRQLAILRSIKEHIKHAYVDAKNEMTMDIVSSSLQLAYQSMITLLGLEGKADLGSEIFSRFCVGK